MMRRRGKARAFTYPVDLRGLATIAARACDTLAGQGATRLAARCRWQRIRGHGSDQSMSAIEIDQPPPYYPDVERALRDLAEIEVRALLRRLLPRLGFFDVREQHGPHELGKDLLAWRRSELGTRDWTGFVVKAGDVTAQVSSSTGIRTVLHQVEQVLDHGIMDPISSDRTHVRACWVVTNGRILPNALDDIAATLRRHHLDKLIRWIDLTAFAGIFTNKFARHEIEKLLQLPAETPA